MPDTYLQTVRQFNRNVRLFLLSAALIGFTTSGGVQGVLLNLYLLRLGYGLDFVGQINSIGGLVFALFSLPAAVLCRRWGSRRTMIGGLMLIVIGSVLLPLVEFIPGAWWTPVLLFIRLPSAMGFALYFVSTNPFLMGSTGGRERTHVFSMQAALWPLAGFAGSLMGGLLPEFFAALLGVSLDDPAPFRYGLLLGAVPLLPGAIALLATSEPTAEGQQDDMVDAAPAPVGPLVFTFIVIFFQTVCMGVVHTFFNVYLDVDLKISTVFIGAIIAAGSLAGGVATLSTPLLSARFGHVRVIVFGSLGIVVSLLPLVLLANWVAAGIGFIGMSVLASLRLPAMAVYRQEMVAPRWRALMAGTANLAAGLSFSATALGGGYVIEGLGYRTLSLISMGFMLVGTVFFWGYFRKPRGEYAKGVG